MTTTGTLVLFDIDGTLIHTAGAGVRGMNSAFDLIHRYPDALEGVPIAGRTDRAIVSEALRKVGVEPSADAISSIRDTYLDHLPAELDRRSDGPYGVLPGVRELLEALAACDAAAVGLLTGNFARGARIKLGHFDLWDRFVLGAFGDDHVDRRDLVPVAIKEAQGLGLSPARVVVIGDTPLDIDCAHAHGATAVGVATGIYSRQVLVTAGADIAVETLGELPPITAWLRA